MLQQLKSMSDGIPLSLKNIRQLLSFHKDDFVTLSYVHLVILCMNLMTVLREVLLATVKNRNTADMSNILTIPLILKETHVILVCSKK